MSIRRQGRSIGSPSTGKASFIAVVSSVVLAVVLVLVLMKFLGERSGGKDSGASAAGFSAAGQATEERAVEASRRKYRRELRFCEALRHFEGADLKCLEDMAAERQDLFFCGEIPAASRQSCLHRVARATGNGRLCDGITQPEMQRDCYLDAAAEGGDVAACEKVADPHTRRACTALARGHTTLCEAVTDAAVRTACYHRMAVKLREPGLCDNVRNTQMPDSFQIALYDCWKDAAVATSRPEDCDRIPHEGVHVNTVGWNIYRQCRDKIEIRKAGAVCRDGPVDLTCRGKTAAAKGDFTMCQNLRSYTEMDICALTFGLRKNEASACASIQEERLRAACVEITAAPAP